MKVQHTEKVQMINGWRRQKFEKIVKRLLHSLAQKLWRTELGVGSGVLRYPPMVDEQDILKQEWKVLDDTLITKTERKRWVKTWLLHPDARWWGKECTAHPTPSPFPWVNHLVFSHCSPGNPPLGQYLTPSQSLYLFLCWIWPWGPHSPRNTTFPCFLWSDCGLFSWFF